MGTSILADEGRCAVGNIFGAFGVKVLLYIPQHRSDRDRLAKLANQEGSARRRRYPDTGWKHHRVVVFIVQRHFLPAAPFIRKPHAR